MTDFPDRDEWTDRPLLPSSEGRCDCCGNVGELARFEHLGFEYTCQVCRDTFDRSLAEDAIEAEKAALEREKAEQRALYDEAAEWDGLDDTDLIGPDERTKPTDLTNNNFSDV